MRRLLNAGSEVWKESTTCKGFFAHTVASGLTDLHYDRGIAFGAEAGAKLPYAATFHWRMGYLPSINDWSNTYLLRNDAAVLFPIVGAFNFKVGVLDEYDSHPARDNAGNLIAKENSLLTTIGIAVSF